MADKPTLELISEIFGEKNDEIDQDELQPIGKSYTLLASKVIRSPTLDIGESEAPDQHALDEFQTFAFSKETEASTREDL